MQHQQQISRRNFLKILAVGAVSAGVGLKFGLDQWLPAQAATATRLLMGTVVNLTIISDDQSAAQSAIEATLNRMATWSKALASGGDYVIFAPGWHHAVQYPGVDEINARHQEMVGRPCDPMVGPAYAAVQILADAIERAGALDRSAIRDAIAATDMETVIGPVTFNGDGTGNVSFALLQYQNGQPELVWPADFATAGFVYPAPPFDER